MKDDLFAELMQSALEALEHARGSRRKFEHVLKKVRPNARPILESDELPVRARPAYHKDRR